MEKKKRIFELDVLKSVAILAMIFDHFTYLFSISLGYMGWASYLFKNYYEINDSHLNNFVSFTVRFQDSNLRLAGHYIFVTLFLFLCGISCTLSRSNLKHGLKTLIGGLVITAATIVLSLVSGEDMYIIFGILTTLGVSILMIALVEKIYDNKWLYLAIGLILIIWGFIIKWWDVERLHYLKELSFWKIIQVILGYKVYGMDHFGIIPCTGVVFLGVFFGKTVYANKKTLLPALDGKWTKPFTFISKHALLVYLLHQVISMIIIFLVFVSAGYRI